MITRRLINCLAGINTGPTNVANTIGNIITATDGRVGIGTAFPNYLLDVNGTIKSTSINASSILTTNLSSTNNTFLNSYLTNVTCTNISSSNVSCTNLISTVISSVNLQITNNSTSIITTTNFSSINLTVTNITSSNITNTSLSTRNLISTNISSTNLTSSNATFTNISANSFSGLGTVRIGTIFMWAGGNGNIPSSYLLCDGTQYLKSTYPLLYDVIGGTPTTFRVPNMSGRVPIGVGTGSGLTQRTLGQTGGQETVTLVTTEMPIHTHTLNTTGLHVHTFDKLDNLEGSTITTRDVGTIPVGTQRVSLDSGAANHDHTITEEGGDQPHNNMQPYIVINYIIRCDLI